MGVEHRHEVHGCTIEGIGATADKVADADQSLELAGFVLGEEQGLHGGVLDLHAVSEATGLVEKGVYGVDVGVPLIDGCLDIVLRRIVGDRVEHADIGCLATRFGCYGRGGDGKEGQDLGCGREMHLVCRLFLIFCFKIMMGVELCG